MAGALTWHLAVRCKQDRSVALAGHLRRHPRANAQSGRWPKQAAFCRTSRRACVMTTAVEGLPGTPQAARCLLCVVHKQYKVDSVGCILLLVQKFESALQMRS